MYSKGLSMVGALALALFSVGAQAATFTVVGNTDSNNTAEFDFLGFSDVDSTGFTVMFKVTNTSALYSPTITGIALTVPGGVTGFDGTESTIPTNWNTFFDIGGVETPQPVGTFDFCAESGNGDKNCGGGNPNDGIAKGGYFDFSLRFLGDFGGGEPSVNDFIPLAARFQTSGVDGEGSDVAICQNEECDDDDLPPVPEPSTMLLMGGSLLALGYFRKRRNS